MLYERYTKTATSKMHLTSDLAYGCLPIKCSSRIFITNARSDFTPSDGLLLCNGHSKSVAIISRGIFSSEGRTHRWVSYI